MCCIYICIYKIGCNIYAKKHLLGENVPIEWKICLLIGKVLIGRKGAYWLEKCIPKGVYLKVITLHIGYTKRCLLIENMPIGQKCAYWLKICLPKSVYWNVTTLHIGYTEKCLLTKNVSIEWKGAYWIKMCLLTEKVPIENEKSQKFNIFKYIRYINLCSHMAQ